MAYSKYATNYAPQSGLIYNLMTPRRLIGFLASSVVFALGYVINNQQLCHID
jgi:hypothetical protein